MNAAQEEGFVVRQALSRSSVPPSFRKIQRTRTSPSLRRRSISVPCLATFFEVGGDGEEAEGGVNNTNTPEDSAIPVRSIELTVPAGHRQPLASHQPSKLRPTAIMGATTAASAAAAASAGMVPPLSEGRRARSPSHDCMEDRKVATYGVSKHCVSSSMHSARVGGIGGGGGGPRTTSAPLKGRVLSNKKPDLTGRAASHPASSAVPVSSSSAASVPTPLSQSSQSFAVSPAHPMTISVPVSLSAVRPPPTALAFHRHENTGLQSISGGVLVRGPVDGAPRSSRAQSKVSMPDAPASSRSKTEHISARPASAASQLTGSPGVRRRQTIDGASALKW